MIQKDKDAGLKPFFVGATIGTTACGSSDDLQTVGSIAKHEHLWLHVDAAMNGAAALCPEHRAMHQGIEHVDSWCFNPHKWLPVHFDCDVFWVADRNDLINAMSVNPEYLRNDATEQGGVIDYRDWQIPLGRRFRALKLWLTLYTEGAEQLRCTIRKHIALSQALAQKLDQLDVEVLEPQTLGLVAFAAKDNQTTEELQRRINHCTERSSPLLKTTRKADPGPQRVVIVVLIEELLHPQINHRAGIKFDLGTNTHGGLVVGAKNKTLVVQIKGPTSE